MNPSLVRRAPVSVALGAVLVVTALVELVTGAPLRASWGTGVPPLAEGRWTTLLTSGLAASGLASLLVSLLVVGLLLPRAERTLGSARTAVALAGGQVAAGALGLGLAALLQPVDRWAALVATAVVVGPLPGVLAAVGCASTRWPARSRRRVQLAAVVVLVMLVLYSGTAGDVLRLTGLLVGMAAGVAGRAARGGPWLAARTPVSRRESRALVALVVAATAVGPLVAALSLTPDGPWAVMSHLFVSGQPRHELLRELCAPGGDLTTCHEMQARARLTGAGPALLSVLPVLLQLLLAEGLRRGRRAAWAGAVAMGAVLTAVGAVVVVAVLRTPAEALPLLQARPGSLPIASVVAPVVAPAAVLVLLLVTRSRFDVRAAAGSVRRWLTLAGAGLAVVVTAYLVAGEVLGSSIAGAPGAVGLLLDLPRRMLPPGYLGEVLPRVVERAGFARLPVEWAGVLCWLVLLLTAWLVVRPAVPTGDAARARALVDRHGSGPLAFMTTWPGNRWWFTADGTSMVAFRVVGGVALTTGDPVGPAADRVATVTAFTAWCTGQGWTPCWYSVGDDVADALPDAGRVQVAAETWLPLGEVAFVGKKWQDVRSALNRARRDGVTAEWVTWTEAPLALREQVTSTSEAWLAGKGLPEMGFTLGGLDELADPAVRCLLAVSAEGRVHGVTSWLPAHRDGVLVGWTLDLMRRSPGCPPGTMEFLIATAALRFQDEGAEFVSLSGAPLALPAGSRHADVLTRLLEVTGRAMEPVYGFRSLLAFKAKFQPRYRPLWLVYPATADLPRIASAVSRAYLPHLSAVQALRLGRALVAGWSGRAGRGAEPRQAETSGAAR